MATSALSDTSSDTVREEVTVGVVADEIGRRRVESLLEHGPLQLAGGASSVADLLDLGAELDLIVLVGDADDVARGGSAQLLRTARARCRIVLLAPDDGSAKVRKALRAGIDGYVPEPEAERALMPTVTAVLAGQLVVPHSIRRRAPWTAFSSRERQVLQLVAAGATNQEIASALHLSESTVKSHLASSFRKLGVSSRAEAATAVLDGDGGLNACALPAAAAYAAAVAPDAVSTAGRRLPR